MADVFVLKPVLTISDILTILFSMISSS